MKTIWIVLALLAVNTAWAAAPATPTVLSGQVLEARHVGDYSYLRIKTQEGEAWVAVGQAPAIKQGAKVTLEDVMAMQNFESKALKKTFPLIYFGSLAGTGAAPQGQAAMPMAAHGGTATTATAAASPDPKIDKATGANARTVAEIVTKASELKDQTVRVRGRVVKYNPGIMGKNWVHLRDGSGTAADNSNDLLLTTAQQTTLGAVVTMSGIVRKDKDFGAGYSYKVLVEDATVQP